MNRRLRVVHSSTASTQQAIDALEATGLMLSIDPDRCFRIVSEPFATVDELVRHMIRHGWKPVDTPACSECEDTERHPCGACPPVGVAEDPPGLGEEPGGPGHHLELVE